LSQNFEELPDVDLSQRRPDLFGANHVTVKTSRTGQPHDWFAAAIVGAHWRVLLALAF
jgi:hypothetical protein